MKAVIVGASAGLGRALAECLAEKGHELILAASDKRDLQRLACDIAIRFNANVDCIELDITNYDNAKLVNDIIERFTVIDYIFIVVGMGSANDTETIDNNTLRKLLEVNYSGPVSLINSAIHHLNKHKSYLIGIGSVAAIRGRSYNIVYGSSKRGLEFYFEAIKHLLSSSNCIVKFYRVGFMATTMLGNKRNGLLVAKSEDIAKNIIENLDTGKTLTYLPSYWQLFAIILKIMPWCIFKRLKI